MRPRVRSYLAFAVFGGFWGCWGASIPAIRDQAGVSEAELGTALLFVGAGALPAMLASGRLVDRWGERATAVLLTVLGGAGVLVAAIAGSFLTLTVALAVVGAASGAADVGINTMAGSAQRATGGPVLARAHATFSAAVVVASLLTGALGAAGASPILSFGLVAAAAAATAVALARAAPVASRRERDTAAPGLRSGAGRLGMLLALGALGALAFAVENGHQSWSALYLRDVLGAGPAVAAAGPAVFAGGVAITRLATGGLGLRRPTTVLLGGALVAAAGTAILGAAGTVAVGLAGLALAAAGTAVLFPTLLGVLTAVVPEHARGAATSVLTVVAYLGFTAGPVYVGLCADALGLPGAMTALALLAATLAIVAPPTLSRVWAAARRSCAPDRRISSRPVRD
jgi:MFS family permease